MTNKENEILHYLISNCNDNGEIKISDRDLADNCNTTTTTIRTFKIKGQTENLFKYNNKVYTIPKETRIDYSYLVDSIAKNKGLKYNATEKNVLGCITDRCNTIMDDEGYTYNTLEYIGKECGISNKQKLSKILNKLVDDGLIEWIKGDYSKKQASRFKVLFGNTVQTPIINNNPTIDNSLNNNNNININIPDNTEVLNKILNELTELKKSMIYQANKFNVVEGVAKMLLDYIEEIHSDMDNLYIINNIQVPKSEKRINIQEIRKYLDTF